MLKRIEGMPIEGRLVYRRGERSLDVEPHPEEGVASLLVNDVQLELDEDATLLYVWGYCPHESWRPAKLEPPRGLPGRLQLLGQLVAGVSKRLNEERWPAFFDESSGWLCVGDPSVRGDAVAFSPGALAIVQAGQLTALWLHPEMTA